jgi:DUF4097 and DUF4098 domain-containing protein YvlB
MPRTEETMINRKNISALLFFLACFAGAAALSLHAAGPFVSEYQENFEKTLPLSPSGSLSLKNTNGNVFLSTWARNEVEIKAVKTARRNKADLDRVKIEVSATGDSVNVNTVYEKTILRNIRVEVKYEVKVPEGVRLEKVRTTNGDVEITGRFGNSDIGTTNGDVKLEGASGQCLAHTTNGDIRVASFKGPVEADTTNGSIHLDVRTIEDSVRAHTTNGSITLKVGGDVNANFKAHTTNGHIQTDFPITIKGVINSRRTVQGTLGNGGPEIDLRTTNGSIVLTR